MVLSSTLTVITTSTGGADSAGETDTWTLVSEIKTPPGTNTEVLICSPEIHSR
jgi:hypothetical protein